MRVTIAVGGKWYALQMAEQLEKNGHLHRVITSHPRWAFRSPSLPPGKILSFPAAELAAQGINRLLQQGAGDYWKAILFDRFVSARSGDCDVFVGFASFCQTTLAALQKRKLPCGLVLERACPHIADQTRLLQEEAGLLGLPLRIDSRTTDRMLAEYQLADRIVVPSRYSQKSFLSRGFSHDKIRVVPLSGKFPAPASPPTRDLAAPFRLLFIGGSFLRKGLLYLLKAWENLRLKDAELIVRSSDLPLRPDIRRLVSGSGVRLLSRSQDLSSLYSQASALCLPSVDDGFGMVALEAMSYALPVIVTENVGAADCVREGLDGFIVKIRSVESLQERILDLYRHPEKRRQMGLAARERADAFTWETYGQTYVEVLEDASRLKGRIS